MNALRKTVHHAARAGLVLMFAASCWAVEPIETNGARDAIAVSSHLEYLADPSNALDFDTILAGGMEGSFEALNQERLNLGVVEGTYWLRFEVRNTTDVPIVRYLEVERTTYDAVDFYRVGGPAEESHQTVHSDTHFYERPVPARQPVFHVSLAPNSNSTIYLRIQTVGATSTDVTLLDPDLYRKRESHRVMAMGLFFGILFIMAAHYLLMFGIFRQRTYLYLAFMVAAMAAYTAAYKGYLFQFVWPNAENISQRFTLPLIGLNFAFTALFAIRFLNARTHSPKLARILYGAAFVGFCIPVVNAVDDAWTDRLAYALGIVLPVVVLATALNCLRTGKRAAWIFLAAWSIILLSAVVYAVAGLGIVPDNFVTSNGPLFAYPITLLMLSLATWDRFKSLEEQHRDSLERRVEERTHELAEALENVRTLEGFISICSHCKKVRDDGGLWSQIESYISTRSEAQFSHGICPGCLEIHYPEVFAKRRAEEEVHETSKD